MCYGFVCYTRRFCEALPLGRVRVRWCVPVFSKRAYLFGPHGTSVERTAWNELAGRCTICVFKIICFMMVSVLCSMLNVIRTERCVAL